MSKKKVKKNHWGGARKGAGRPEGKTKAKICVSVNESVWQSALRLWRGRASPLVENLLSAYVDSAGGSKTAEAV
jgi:hypothetical protein